MVKAGEFGNPMKTVGYLSALLHLGICRMLRSVLGNSGRKAGGRLPNRPVSAAELRFLRHPPPRPRSPPVPPPRPAPSSPASRSPFSKKLTVRRILVSRGGGELADLDVANDGGARQAVLQRRSQTPRHLESLWRVPQRKERSWYDASRCMTAERRLWIERKSKRACG